MNVYSKTRIFRIALGVIILTIGFLLGDGSFNLGWWYLGLLPLIVGLTGFCPLCSIFKKCTLKGQK